MKKSESNIQEKDTSKPQKPSEETREEKRMEFLMIIFRNLRLSQREISKISGTSQQLISWWKKKDNARLITVCQMFSNMGMQLTFTLEPLEEEEVKVTNHSFEMTISNIYMPRINSRMSGSFLDNIIYSDNMLKPVAVEIKKHYADLASFCKANDLKYHSVYSWMSKDSIKISELIWLSQILKTKIHWSLSQKD